LSEEDRGDDVRVTPGASRGEHPEWKLPDVLDGVRRRDARALGRFFDGAFPFVYRLAFRMLGNREAAEDIAQDVFLKVHRAAEQLQTDRDPAPWLATITYNACRDARRRAGARSEVATDATTIGEGHAVLDTPEDALVRRERERIVQHALLELDEPSRAVILLHDYNGLPHEEIATVLGMSHAGVRKRYSRGLKRLAEVVRSRL
jgi:RNA polymerase sigma-70 factor (ECF subfamily)